MPGHEFQNSVLEGMRRLFGFKAGFNVTAIDVGAESEGKAQPVIDVGRFASIGSGYLSGWFLGLNAMELAPASATTIDASLDLYTALVAFNTVFGNRVQAAANVDIWYYGTHFGLTETTAGEFTSAVFGVVEETQDVVGLRTLTPIPRSIGRLLGTWLAADARNVDATTWIIEEVYGMQTTSWPQTAYPILFQPDASLLYRVIRGGVVGTITCEWNHRFWIGRRGAIPPGM